MYKVHSQVSMLHYYIRYYISILYICMFTMDHCLWFICSQSKREFLKKFGMKAKDCRVCRKSQWDGIALNFFAVRLETKLSQTINLLNQQDIEVWKFIFVSSSVLKPLSKIQIHHFTKGHLIQPSKQFIIEVFPVFTGRAGTPSLTSYWVTHVVFWMN